MATRKRDRLLWIWPVAAVVALAICSEYWGTFGVLAAAVAVVGGLVLVTGAGYFPRGMHLVVGAVVCAMLGAVFIARSSGNVSDRPTRPRPAAAAAQPTTPSSSVRAALVPGADLHGKQLADAVLDGVVAPGCWIELDSPGRTCVALICAVPICTVLISEARTWPAPTSATPT